MDGDKKREKEVGGRNAKRKREKGSGGRLLMSSCHCLHLMPFPKTMVPSQDASWVMQPTLPAVLLAAGNTVPGDVIDLRVFADDLERNVWSWRRHDTLTSAQEYSITRHVHRIWQGAMEREMVSFTTWCWLGEHAPRWTEARFEYERGLGDCQKVSDWSSNEVAHAFPYSDTADGDKPLPQRPSHEDTGLIISEHDWATMQSYAKGPCVQRPAAGLLCNIGRILYTIICPLLPMNTWHCFGDVCNTSDSPIVLCGGDVTCSMNPCQWDAHGIRGGSRTVTLPLQAITRMTFEITCSDRLHVTEVQLMVVYGDRTDATGQPERFVHTIRWRVGIPAAGVPAVTETSSWERRTPRERCTESWWWWPCTETDKEVDPRIAPWIRPTVYQVLDAIRQHA